MRPSTGQNMKKSQNRKPGEGDVAGQNMGGQSLKGGEDARVRNVDNNWVLDDGVWWL
jgi:hypothetical protein